MSLRLLIPPTLAEAKIRARAELLSTSLTARLKQPVHVEAPKDYAEMEDRIISGQAELAWLPPRLCARVLPSVRAIFRTVRRGGSTFRSAMVVRKDEITTLDALAGKRAAWTDPLSLGGHLLAVEYLRARGFVPRRLLATQRFFGTYREAMGALVTGEADVAATPVTSADETALRAQLNDLVGGAQRKLAVLAYSDEAPNDAFVITRAVAEKDFEALADRLFPPGDKFRATSVLLDALDAEGVVRAEAKDYKPLILLVR